MAQLEEEMMLALNYVTMLKCIAALLKVWLMLNDFLFASKISIVNYPNKDDA